MAARVARQLWKQDHIQVETVSGGLGEFSVFMDGRKTIDTSRLWYPRPSKIVARLRELLANN
ncbi:MAG TPA: hypothetical protein VF075_10400 [Pyrinomonadaceae bacterium]